MRELIRDILKKDPSVVGKYVVIHNGRYIPSLTRDDCTSAFNEAVKHYRYGEFDIEEITEMDYTTSGYIDSGRPYTT